MNSEHNNKLQIEGTKELKEIPKWTRKYAQNRTLTNFLVMVIFMFISMVIVALSYTAGAAFIKGNITVLRVCIVVLFAIVVFVFIICVSKFGGVIIRRWLDRLIYDHEGTALMPEPKSTKKKKWLGFVFVAVVFICIQGSYYLSMEGYISFKYLQPISALFLVPFLVHLYLIQRPRIGPLFLICPILYTIHAILIIAGVAIYFKGYSGIWNMAIPFFGYTFLAHIICHVYSRYALKKLKGLAHPEGEAANEV
ncbi:MAG: hypothetical protein ACFFCW_38020 [Candidatus Hodarchaeota archaeon]